MEGLVYSHSAHRNMSLLKFIDSYRYIYGLDNCVPTMVGAMGDRIEFEEVGTAFRVTMMLA